MFAPKNHRNVNPQNGNTMKNKFLFLVLLVGAMAVPQSAYAYDFYAVSPSGHKLFYNIVDGSATVTFKTNSIYFPSYDTLIGDVVIPDSVVYGGQVYKVTAIGNKSFFNCDSMTSITIPASVTHFGSDAFKNSDGLTMTYYLGSVEDWCRIVFDDKLANPLGVSHAMWLEDTVLTDLVIPAEVSAIGDYAFYGFYGLQSVHFSDSLTTIGDSSFMNCTGLTSITIPNSVTSIGTSAFAGCTGITSITIPNSVTSLGSSAFADCTGLASVTLPNSITSLSSLLFSGCSSLTSIDIPNSVTYIGNGAFSSSGLYSIIVPNSVDSMGWSVFSECRALTHAVLPDSSTIIQRMTFFDCIKLDSITIPQSVTMIDIGAFMGSGIRCITIPSSVTCISMGAFQDCNDLEMTIFTGTLSEWCQIEFVFTCTSNPTWCSHRLTIGGEEIVDLVIPDDVTTIRDFAFAGCSGFNSVYIPGSVDKIGTDAFSGCRGLTTLTIPEGVTTIDGGAFQDCSGLTSITIPNSVVSIGREAFKGCSGITTVTIPSNVGSIGQGAFSDCTGLAMLMFNADSCTNAQYLVSGCSNLTSFIIGNNVKIVPESICNGVASLVTLVIGHSVTRIDRFAFRNCTNLLFVYSMAHVPPAMENAAFYYGNNLYNSNITVVVPCSATSNYQNAPVWQQYSIYEESQYAIAVSSNNLAYGSVDVIQRPACSDMQAYIQASPNQGYHFVQWSDGNTQNPRNVEVDQDTSIMAIFAEGEVGIADVAADGVRVSTAEGRIVVEGADGHMVSLFDAMGRQLAVRYGGSPIRLDVPASGIYLVKVGPYAARRVAVVR